MQHLSLSCPHQFARLLPGGLLLAALLASLLMSQRALALPVPGLYEAEVPVANDSAIELQQGARTGLLQVLVKISGRQQLESSREVRAALQRPADYYYQYAYESPPAADLIEPNTTRRLLKLSFDPDAIAKLLREAGLPVWGANRPAVLLWVATAEGFERRLLKEDDGNPLQPHFQALAYSRGLPLIFPLLDLQDASTISAAEVWGSFWDKVELASQRYQTGAILTGRVQQERTGRWVGKWGYLIADKWREFNNTAASRRQLVTGVMDLLANELAVQYALNPTSKLAVTLTVEGLNGLADYAALMSYLDSLAPVLRTSVKRLKADEVALALQAEGQQEQLLALIELDKRLAPLSSPVTGERSVLLHYRWIK